MFIKMFVVMVCERQKSGYRLPDLWRYELNMQSFVFYTNKNVNSHKASID